MPLWSDFFKIFSYSSEQDPLAKKKDPKQFPTAGISQPTAIGNDMGAGDSGGNSGFRQTTDMIDTTTLNNRTMRYSEYERLRNVPEIEMAMTVFADEACVAGDTKIATPFGFITIKELAETKADERFLVYSYDLRKKDYTLGWAFAPRLVKEEETITIILDNGDKFTATADHKVLKKDGTWIETGALKFGDELMPFYRQPANTRLTKRKHHQYTRVFSFNKGWLHERQFVDDWKSGKTNPEFDKLNRAIRMIGGGLTTRQIEKLLEHDWHTIEGWLHKEGFSHKEVKSLYKNENQRRVIGVQPGPKQGVYDLSVEDHKCFATESVILHNCQKDENGNIFKVETKNDEVREEVNFVLLHRKMLNLNRNGLVWFKNLCIFGDWFVELVVNPNNPKEGIYRTVPLPPETIYRIESVKGKVIEYQQSKEGPDYQAIVRGPITGQNETEINQSNAIRFAASQIVHFRIGDDRKTFYPYGQSLIEPARGPAHSLRLMEDAMVVYRLCVRSYDKIKTRKSWKYMKDITVHDEVHTYNQITKKLEIGKVIWHGLVGQKKTYKVKSKHSSVTVTAEHPILVYDRESETTDFVQTKSIVPGKHSFVQPLLSNFTSTKINRFYKTPYVLLSKQQMLRYKHTKYASKQALIDESLTNADERINAKNRTRCSTFLTNPQNCSLPESLGLCLCESFDLGQPIKKNKGEKTPERINLPEYVTEEFATLFGFLIGDGCINWHNGSAKLLFAAGEYDYLNQKYLDILIKFFGDCHFQQDKRLVEGLGMYCTNSATACEILENMEFKGNAHTKRIPSWVFSEKPEIRKAFIIGLADAEGDKRGQSKKTWQTTIRLCNKELIEDIKEIWESLGFHASEVKKIDEPDRWIKETFVPAGTSWEVYISETVVPFHDEIISVSREGVEDVYDLTVEHPTERNFLCNGIPVHNSRAPERRVFYIDVGQLPPFKAEAFIDRLKDQFRKRKVTSNRGTGANAVEERWQPPAQDEDYWVPIRPNGTNTRIETLPGAENLGEIDDAIYFRNKLLTALNFPKNYFNNEDPNTTRITLSAQDVKFARMIERLQSHFEDGILEIAERHLQLRGFPDESFQDLRIKMTPPSDWRELSRAEVTTSRYGNAGTLKSGQLMADYDIMVKILKIPEDEADEMLARLKIQKLEDLKLQVLAQNPGLLGIGIPGQEDSTSPELGSEPGGPVTMPAPGAAPPPAPNGAGGMPPPPPTATASAADDTPPLDPKKGNIQPQEISIPDPDQEDVKKYDLEIQTYEIDQDKENIDYSVGED